MILPPFATLKTAIALLLAALALATAGIVWSQRERADAEAAVTAAEAALAAARNRQRQGQTEARLIEQHLDAYRALAARGFVGAENRLAWIEAVQLANRDAGLYGLTYTLSPRTAAPAELAAGLPLMQTRMTLKLPLLVETDLPRFIDAVRVRAPGIVRVERCELRHLIDPLPPSPDRPELDAECELLWFTVATGEAA